MSAKIAHIESAEPVDAQPGTKGERTRAAIADTAIRILKSEGYRGLTVAALAEGAGLRRNSYYVHFKNLDELIDQLSMRVLNTIGRRSVLARVSAGNQNSVVFSRLRFIVSLPERDQTTAHVLAELYVNHDATAKEIHRRLVLDMTADRRRGIHSATGSEMKIAAMVIASATMEMLRERQPIRRSDHTKFLDMLARVSGYVGEIGSS